MPPQNPPGGVVETVEAAGATSSTATASAMGANFVMNLLFTGSMNSLWSLLNSVQVIVYAPMFQNLKFPNNASALNEKLTSIASFDIINTPDWIDHYIIDLGDDGEPFSYNFEQCGFDTTWFLSNSSVVVWTWSVNIVLLGAYFLIRECAKRVGIFKSLRSKMSGYFFFNGPLRLFMETFLDLYLSSLLNVVTADNETDNPSIVASNKVALAVFIIGSALMPILGLLYLCNFAKIDENSNYVAFLDGTRI